MTLMNRRNAMASMALAWPLTARSHEYYLLAFTLVHPWALPSEPGQNNAPVYFTVQDVLHRDRLLKASSPIAESIEFRKSMDNEEASLVELNIDPATAPLFGAAGLHLRLQGLRQPLQLYGAYPLMLSFEQSGRVLVQISVGAH